jgi:hypothetical protein
VLDILVKLHSGVIAIRSVLLASRIFDYEHLRWETGYFVRDLFQGFSE